MAKLRLKKKQLFNRFISNTYVEVGTRFLITAISITSNPQNLVSTYHPWPKIKHIQAKNKYTIKLNCHKNFAYTNQWSLTAYLLTVF